MKKGEKVGGDSTKILSRKNTAPNERIKFPGASDGKESYCNEGDLGLIPGLGRSPGGGQGNALQNSCLENTSGQRSLAGYSLWGSQEWDTTERLSTGRKWRILENAHLKAIPHMDFSKHPAFLLMPMLRITASVNHTGGHMAFLRH